MKWTIGRKIGLGFGLALVLFPIIGYVSYRTTTELIESNDWVSHSYQVLGTLNELLTLLINAETGTRGFIIAGTETALQPYVDSVPRIAGSIQLVRTVTADNFERQKQLDALEPLIAIRLDVMSQLVAARRAGGMPAVQKLIDSKTLKSVMNDIRKLIAEMDADERALLSQRYEKAKSNATASLIGTTIGWIAAVALILLTAFFVSRSISRNIKTLNRGAALIGGGDLTHRVIMRSRDETGELAEAFNTMAAGLEQAQSSLKKANAELEKRVARRTAELRKALVTLEQKNRELEEFAYVASHDLQEPLRKIQAFGDRLKTQISKNLDQKGFDYLDRMYSAAERMQSLISDLLTFSRVNTQAQTPDLVDLDRILREVLSDLEIRIEHTQGRVEIGTLPHIQADPTQMRQLFQNLIGNALKFHKPDEPPVVRVSSRLYDDRCEISVSDNGIGFESQYSERIFMAFKRLHGRNEYEGTGIGLAVVRRIVERHSGTIKVSSEVGKGSTFTIDLPLVQDIADPTLPEASTAGA